MCTAGGICTQDKGGIIFPGEQNDTGKQRVNSERLLPVLDTEDLWFQPEL